METKRLRAEPTEKEIAQAAHMTHQKMVDSLIDLRNYCELNRTNASELLGISCKDLRKYEERERDMLMHNFSKYFSTYYAYAHANDLSLPEEMELICRIFIPINVII